MSDQTTWTPPADTVALIGIDGNPYYVIGAMEEILRKKDVSEDEINIFRKDAMDGDYCHMLDICKAAEEKYDLRITWVGEAKSRLLHHCEG